MLGKIILKPLKFRKGSSSPSMTEQIQILQGALECISTDLKVTLDTLKSAFNVFKGNPRWVSLVCRVNFSSRYALIFQSYSANLCLDKDLITNTRRES